MNSELFDRDYYERGLETGKSCYENYRWMPELTVPLAMTIIDFLHIERGQTILDFGCAKGYLVKAFRLLYRRSIGVDTSKYAIECSEGYCMEIDDIVFSPHEFDFCVAKDVFEHIPLPELSQSLEWISGHSNTLFAIVPLGENGKYNSPKNDLDVTHITCENEEWWKLFFTNNHWEVKDFRYRIDGMKDAYYGKTPPAHGFFTLESSDANM